MHCVAWHGDSHLAQWQSPQTFLWRCRFNSCSGIINFNIAYVFVFCFFIFFVCFVFSFVGLVFPFFVFFIFCLLLCGTWMCTCCLLKKLFLKNSLDFFLFPFVNLGTLFVVVTIHQGTVNIFFWVF